MTDMSSLDQQSAVSNEVGAAARYELRQDGLFVTEAGVKEKIGEYLDVSAYGVGANGDHYVVLEVRNRGGDLNELVLPASTLSKPAATIVGILMDGGYVPPPRGMYDLLVAFLMERRPTSRVNVKGAGKGRWQVGPPNASSLAEELRPPVSVPLPNNGTRLDLDALRRRVLKVKFVPKKRFMPGTHDGYRVKKDGRTFRYLARDTLRRWYPDHSSAKQLTKSARSEGLIGPGRQSDTLTHETQFRGKRYSFYRVRKGMNQRTAGPSVRIELPLDGSNSR